MALNKLVTQKKLKMSKNFVKLFQWWALDNIKKVLLNRIHLGKEEMYIFLPINYTINSYCCVNPFKTAQRDFIHSVSMTLPLISGVYRLS